MKLSLKFREETRHKNPLLRAKIPVTILSFPAITAITAGDSTDLSFSLRSNFSSGPSLSLSYHPTLSPPSNLPFSISLKSGIGLFGSPHNSPLTFTANFNPNSLTPTFSLVLKPQFGNFSLFKSVSSGDNGGIKVDGVAPNLELSNGSVSDFEIKGGLGDGSGHWGMGMGMGMGKGLGWGDLKKDGSILSGVLVAARTTMPVAKTAVVNLRWGVSFPPQSGGVSVAAKPQFPVLVMNKVSLERIDEAKKGDEEKKMGNEAKAKAKEGEFELLKGMCSWMKKEVEELQRENWEMKKTLEGVRGKGAVGSRGRGEDVVGKRMMPLPNNDGCSEFEKWRSKNGGANGNGNKSSSVDENGHKDSMKSRSRMSEVENELQKAIKAAAS